MQTSVFDPKIVRGPKAYDGDRKKFTHWAVYFKGYIMAVAPELKKMMDTASRLGEPIDVDDDLTTDDQKKLNHQLYYILTSVLENEAMDTLLACPEGNALEWWRRECQRCAPDSATHATIRLSKILNPTHVSGDFQSRLTKWEVTRASTSSR